MSVELLKCYRDHQEFYRSTVDSNGNEVLDESDVRVLARNAVYRDVAWNSQDSRRSEVLKKMIKLQKTSKFRDADEKFFGSFSEDLK